MSLSKNLHRYIPLLRKTCLYINGETAVRNGICSLYYTNNNRYSIAQKPWTLHFPSSRDTLKTLVRFQNTNIDEKITTITPKDTKNYPKNVTLSRAEKLKKAVKEYGPTVIIFHVSISLMSLGTCYLLVSIGLDMGTIFDYLNLQNWASKSETVTSAGTFAVAYAIHKVFAPVRIMITLTSVPFIVRYLRRIGFIKK